MTNQSVQKKASCVYGLDKGIATGMSFTKYIAFLFMQNESAPPSAKKTDHELAVQLYKEFPDRPTALYMLYRTNGHTLNQYRQKYNRGQFTNRIVPPVPSFRYNSHGQPVNGKTGTLILEPAYVRYIHDNHVEKYKRARQNMESGRTKSSEGFWHQQELPFGEE